MIEACPPLLVGIANPAIPVNHGSRRLLRFGKWHARLRTRGRLLSAHPPLPPQTEKIC